MNIQEHFNDLFIPDFSNFIRDPHCASTKRIDATRLMAEIILHDIGGYADSYKSQKMLICGDFSIVIRYYRDKDKKYHPCCVLSLGIDTSHTSQRLLVKQLQGSNDKKVAYLFHANFNTVDYFVTLIEESFLKNSIPVIVEDFPEGIEGASYASSAISKYRELNQRIKYQATKYL